MTTAILVLSILYVLFLVVAYRLAQTDTYNEVGHACVFVIFALGLANAVLGIINF